MSDAEPPLPGDAELGMNEPITRRDFLGSVLLASGAVLPESASPAQLAGDHFTGCGGVGEYSTSNGNTWEVMQAGHSIRYGTYDPQP
jgi:spermidine dehydrogenase